MRFAESITLEKAGLRTAAKKMNDLGISSLFVTDKENVLLGAVTIDEVSRMLREQKNDLREIIDEEVCTVEPDASIDLIITEFLKSKYPIAVVDSSNKLEGIVFKSTVLSGIAGEGGGEHDT